MNRIHRPVVALAAFALATGALAQNAQDDQAKDLTVAEKIKISAVDMPVGVSPASFLVGSSGENVPRVSTFRQFFTQFGRAYNEKGEIAKGIAVEVSPSSAFSGLSWAQIKSNYATRIWSQTTVSLATTVKSDKAPAKAAFGLQSVLYAPAVDEALVKWKEPSGNCRSIAMSLVDAMKEAQALEKESDKDRAAAANETMNPIAREALLKQADAKLARARDLKASVDPTTDRLKAQEAIAAACYKELNDTLTKWNQSLVVFGAGHVSPSGDTTEKSSNAMWLSAAYGFPLASKDKGDDKDVRDAVSGLLTVHLRHNQRVAVKDTADADAMARQRLMGVNLRMGNGRDALFAEHSIAKYSAEGHTFNDRKRSVIGYERKLFTDMYFSMGYARDTGAPKSQQAVLARIQWGFSDKPPFSLR